MVNDQYLALTFHRNNLFPSLISYKQGLHLTSKGLIKQIQMSMQVNETKRKA